MALAFCFCYCDKNSQHLFRFTYQHHLIIDDSKSVYKRERKKSIHRSNSVKKHGNIRIVIHFKSTGKSHAVFCQMAQWSQRTHWSEFIFGHNDYCRTERVSALFDLFSFFFLMKYLCCFVKLTIFVFCFINKNFSMLELQLININTYFSFINLFHIHSALTIYWTEMWFFESMTTMGWSLLRNETPKNTRTLYTSLKICLRKTSSFL